MSSPSDDALSRLATKQHGIFSARQIADLGYTHAARQARLTAGRWELLYDGVYRMGGAPTTWRGNLLAACWAAGVGALASHCSAAALRHLPSGQIDPIEIMCARWKRARHSGLVVHESLVIDEEDQDTVHGIPSTSTPRPLFALSR